MLDISNIKKKFKNSQIFELKENYIQNIYKKLNKKIPYSSNDKDFTYKEILEKLKKENITIYITGGTIRNLLQDELIDNDIDIYIDITSKNLNNIFHKKFTNLRWYHSKNYEPYFLIGQKECSNEYLEILCLNVFDKIPDAPCNSLFVDYNNFIIYDLSGYGIVDTVKKIWRKPPDIKFDNWMKSREILWRMIKFKLKNYDIGLTNNEKKKIYTYWINNIYKFPKDWLIPWRNNLDKNDIFKILKIIEDDSKNIGFNFIDLLSKLIENNVFNDFYKCSELKSENDFNKLIKNIKSSNKKTKNKKTKNNTNNKKSENKTITKNNKKTKNMNIMSLLDT